MGQRRHLRHQDLEQERNAFWAPRRNRTNVDRQHLSKASTASIAGSPRAPHYPPLPAAEKAALQLLQPNCSRLWRIP